MKEWYVDYLVQMLLDENNDHEDLTAPLLVIASVSKSEFKLKNLHSYSYEVSVHMQIKTRNVINHSQS